MQSKMSLYGHLQELRKRLFMCFVAIVICMAASFVYSDQLLNWILIPFKNIDNIDETTLVVSTLFEGFVTHMQLSLYGAIFFSSPFLLFQILKFCFPGMTSKEKKVVSIVLACSFCLILSAIYLGYSQLLPISLNILLSETFIFNDANLFLNFHHTVFYLIHFIVMLSIAFQFPIVLDILLALKILSFKKVLRSSKWIVIGIFLSSAIITPPDLFSQLSLALPLLLLYCLALIIAFVFKLGREEKV